MDTFAHDSGPRGGRADVAAGRVLFTTAEPGEPDAALIERNDGPAADIEAPVREGYLIHTRTDADTKEARTNDTARRDAMTASGAPLLH